VNARRALQMLFQDLRWLPRSLWVNGIGSWVVTPRLLRNLIYRSAGLRIHSPNVAERCRFTGDGGTTIGRGTFVNTDCVFDAFAAITVGEDCAIAMQVLITTSSHDITAEGRMSPEPIGKPVTIGNHCWIGARSTILPGVTIGEGCIVAAGALVAADCEPGALYAGVPARKIRDLTAVGGETT
jgi:maltose O-acetyltransferase